MPVFVRAGTTIARIEPPTVRRTPERRARVRRAGAAAAAAASGLSCARSDDSESALLSR